MKYDNIVQGKFIRRVNRFIAEVSIDGEQHTVHVKNTGRCKELFIEGVPVFLELAKNPDRKTKFSLVGIIKEPLMINIDSQIPNSMVFELLMAIKEFQDTGLYVYPTPQQPNRKLIDMFNLKFPGLQYIKKEVTYGKSRFDVYYECKDRKGYIEIKGVTLEDNKAARFPDAPTTRGARHVSELIDSVEDGYVSYIFFLVQLKGVDYFEPNDVTDPEFTKTLWKAQKSGVEVLCYDSLVTADSIYINEAVEVRLKNIL